MRLEHLAKSAALVRRIEWVPSLLALVILTVCHPASAGVWKGRETTENGVVHIQNPAEAVDKPITVTLKEQWRVGGENEEEGEFFGLITDIGVHPSGEVYLVDRQLSEVKVFSKNGHYLRTIGREGEGPGEFRRPGDVFFDPDGNLGVVQTQPSRVVMFKPDGTPAAPFNLPSPENGGGFNMLQGVTYRGGSLVLQGGNFRMAEGTVDRTNSLVRIDRQGKELARFAEMTSTSNMARMVIKEDEFGYLWTVGPQGDVYAALDRTWKLQVWDPSGKLQRIVTLDYEPVMRTAGEIEKHKEALGSRLVIRGARGRIEPEFDISDRDRDIRWLSVADDGHIWVLSSRGVRDLPAGTIGNLDVFDPQGRYLQRVTWKGDCDFEEDRMVLAGDRLFVIKQFESALRAMSGREAGSEEVTDEGAVPMSVICYDLQWTRGGASVR